jgi:Rhodopirellula transposase DDE domain
MHPAGTEEALRAKFAALAPALDERSRRLWAAAEARAIGYGGQSLLAKVTGMARSTIYLGLKELAAGPPDPGGRIRRVGGGGKPLTHYQPGLKAALEALVEPTSRGDPESPLRWACKSTRRLQAELRRQGFSVGRQKVSELLAELGYSLQANRKTREGASHPDRDAQFRYIDARVRDFRRRGQPAVSVDTKKKELVGDFKNGGREWRPRREPEPVRVHDFLDKALGKAIPYGVYDLAANQGWVSVGTDHDTAEFAAATIRRWWGQMGLPLYPLATALLVTADGGGSNGNRNRLWKVALQRLADELGLRISVCHYPPGTSKWNKIEHRLFSQIAVNWRGQPLTSLEVIVSLIGATATRTGLRVRAEVDRGVYPTGIGVSDEQLAAVRIRRARFHGEWNYTILPSRARS